MPTRAELTYRVLLSSGRQQAAVTMIDSFVTELWKSFNPFIKLDGWTGGQREERCGLGGSTLVGALYPHTYPPYGFCEEPSDTPSPDDTHSQNTLQHV